MAKDMENKGKGEGLYPSYAVPLDSLANIRGEMARLYRLGLQGKVAPDKMTKFVYVLREIRACIEIATIEDVQKQLAGLSARLEAGRV